MEFVLMIALLGTIIIVTLAIIMYPKKDIFINKIKFKSKLIEFEISAKQKNDPPAK